MTRIKICGITNLEDALAAVDAGADMLGFVFADSTRRIEPAVAREIIAALPPHVTPVAVFRNALADVVAATVEFIRARVIQLHGDERPEVVAMLPVTVLKRIAVIDGDTRADLIERINAFPAPGYLLDPGAGAG